MAACIRLILVVVRGKGDPEKRFETLYCPLVHKLQEVLKKHKLEICSRPFGDLARNLIGMYLATVLGAKPPETKLKVRDIGCGCTDCVVLDKFIHNNDVDIKFSCSSPRRTHLEHRVLHATDLVTFLTDRSSTSHVLVISKRAELVNQLQWQTRLARAQNFLSSIGNNRMISMIMSPRYEDVEQALNGTQPYTMKLPATHGTLVAETTQASNTGIIERLEDSKAGLPSEIDSMTLKRKREDEETDAIGFKDETGDKPLRGILQYFTPQP
jgi:hypothetical protein